MKLWKLVATDSQNNDNFAIVLSETAEGAIRLAERSRRLHDKWSVVESFSIDGNGKFCFGFVVN